MLKLCWCTLIPSIDVMYDCFPWVLCLMCVCFPLFIDDVVVADFVCCWLQCEYHVVFLDECVTRSWIRKSRIQPLTFTHLAPGSVSNPPLYLTPLHLQHSINGKRSTHRQ